MHTATKYRLQPTTAQTKLLAQIAGSRRWLWNYMLDLNKRNYEEKQKFVFAYDMHKSLPGLKKEHEWLKLSPSQSLQQVCIDLDRAIQLVWKSKFGFPKFKTKHKCCDSFRIPNQSNSIKPSSTHILLPKIGHVKWKKHRELPSGKIKSVTISRDLDRWYISVLTEVPEVNRITEVNKSKTVGIDLGVAHFATLSDGTKIKSPNFLKKQLRKLKYQQRFLKNKVNRSNNKRKQYDRVARIHRKIRNQRNNWLHQLSHKLTEKYQVICVEDLKIRDLLQKKQFSRSIADQGWGIFVSHLKYKQERKGNHLTKINTYLPSTKTCSCCGEVRTLKLSDRVYICENPGCTDYLKTKDRDHNAAINIHIWGLMATNVNLYTPGTGGIEACGDTLSGLSNQGQVSTKQETM